MKASLTKASSNKPEGASSMGSSIKEILTRDEGKVISKAVGMFEKLIALVLALILGVIIILSTINLVKTVVTDLMAQPFLLFDVHNMLEFLSTLIYVVIAVELLSTVRVYFDEKVARLEIIFLIAVMALARHVIILNLEEVQGMTLLGMAAIIAALSLGYFFVRRVAKSEPNEKHKADAELTAPEPRGR